MKLRITSVMLLLFYLLTGNRNLFAQGDDAQKAMAEYMTPGKMHEFLAKNAGEWKTVMKLWMSPGGEPVVSEGTAVSEMILGGRYLQTKHTGTIMNMPMMGLGLDAFDNGKKIFVSVWLDNFGTGVMVLEGTLNEDHTVLTYTGKSYEPVSKKEIKVKEILRCNKPGHEVMEMYMETDGKEFKSMEVDMTKIK
jgi:hypothetical protein